MASPQCFLLCIGDNIYWYIIEQTKIVKNKTNRNLVLSRFLEISHPSARNKPSEPPPPAESLPNFVDYKPFLLVFVCCVTQAQTVTLTQ